MTHAEDSNELESKPHDTSEDTEKDGLSLLAGIAVARDESCMGEELRGKSMRGVSLKRAATDQSLNRKEGINIHTTKQVQMLLLRRKYFGQILADVTVGLGQPVGITSLTLQ